MVVALVNLVSALDNETTIYAILAIGIHVGDEPQTYRSATAMSCSFRWREKKLWVSHDGESKNNFQNLFRSTPITHLTLSILLVTEIETEIEKIEIETTQNVDLMWNAVKNFNFTISMFKCIRQNCCSYFVLTVLRDDRPPNRDENKNWSKC